MAKFAATRGTPSHTVWNTIACPWHENGKCAPQNSPDLNRADYAIWGALQERVYYRRKFDTVDQLKQAIVLQWRALDENGEHIEHVFH